LLGGGATAASSVISTSELPALLSEALAGTPAAAGAGVGAGAGAGGAGGAGAAAGLGEVGAAGGTAMATAGPLIALAAMLYGAQQTFTHKDTPGVDEVYMSTHPNADLQYGGDPYDIIDRNTGKSILGTPEERAKKAEAQRKFEELMRIMRRDAD